jgi:signal transduction histidine kinase
MTLHSLHDRRSVGTGFALSLLLVALATWVEMLLVAHGGPHFVFLASGLAIAATAWLAGFGPALLAVLISSASADYFALVPGQWLDVGTALETTAFCAFVLGWIGIAWIVRGTRARADADAAARLEADRAAAQMARLADLSAALGRARSEAGVIETAVQEPLHALKADAGMFLVVADDQESAIVSRAVAYDVPTDLTDRHIPLHDRCPLSDAVRRRALLTLPSRDVLRDGDIVPSAYTSMAAIPIVIGGKVAAVVRLDFRAARTFSEDDKEFLDLLGRFAAQILDRARQYESAQRARDEAEGLRARADQELSQRQKTEQALRASETRYRALATRTTRLHGLTAALSEAVTVDAVAKALVQQGNVVVGATSASVALSAEEGRALTILYAEAYGRALRQPAPLAIEPGLCETAALQTRTPVFVASWEESQEQYWRSATAAADAAYVSSAVLPLVVEGTTIGLLRFDFSVPVNFDAEYQALLVSVAQHCTQALDRARLYEAAQQARAAAEAANRHKDEFLSIVSHELRTPLNAVLGWAAMLQKGTSDQALSARALQSIHDNATRQAKLIDDLLDLSRIVAGRAPLDRQNVDLAKLITGVVESFIPTAATNDVELRLAALPHVIIHGDARRLEQVFFNLLSNGLKFTGVGGRIDIEARLDDSSQVEVSVTDTGVGIEPEFLPHVFERFRQADSTAARHYGGLGLGLSIAQQLVDAHHGSISVESEGKGRGARFIVRLPVAAVLSVAAPEQPVVTRARPVVEAPRLDGVRVLGVDDEPAAREILDYALKAQGAEVTVASSAAEAYDILAAKDFDVLLADIAMPEEDGCALLRRVRSSGNRRMASIPAAAVTAHARDEERRAVLAAGFQLHLVKPIEPADLARAVDQLARRTAIAAPALRMLPSA